MQINVSGLLRDFPRVRRAALAGERVTIKTREGNLILMAEPAPARELFGALRDLIVKTDDDIDQPTLSDEEWQAGL